MGWSDGIDRNMLRHIIALLLSLAAIADLAVNAKAGRRRQVMLQLRRGEGSALRMLGWSDASDAEIVACFWSFEPQDFRQVAVSLRALAIALHHMSRFIAISGDVRSFNDDWANREFRVRRLTYSTPSPAAPTNQAVPLIDTS